MGRPLSLRVSVQCRQCNNTFEVTETAIDRGGGKFCCKECYHASREGKERGSYPKCASEEKICEACLKPFTVGGTGNPPRTQTLCSMDCQRRSRKRKTVSHCNTLTLEQVSYIAGIVDGEGSIMLTGRSSGSIALNLSISNTCKPLVDWLSEATGTGQVTTVDHQKYGRTQNRTGYQWKVHGDTAENLIRQMLPYLVVKKTQANLALEFQEKRLNPSFRRNKAEQEPYRKKMKELNARGAEAVALSKERNTPPDG